MTEMSIPPDVELPPDVHDVDVALGWCGSDVERLHVAYFAEMARDRDARRPLLLTRLHDRLGWPAPDTPESEVLWGAGRPGNPVGSVLARELARPEWAQRHGLIAVLQQRAAGAGTNAYASTPVQPSFKDQFR